MKKFLLGLLIPVAVVSVSSVSANAAKVYDGTPRAIRGYYRTKMHKTYFGHHKYYWNFRTLHITGSQISEDYGAQTDQALVYRLAHSNLSKHDFVLAGRYVPMGGESPAYLAYMHKTKKTLKVDYFDESGSKVTGHTTYYKFSGKTSKVRNYPYK